VNIEVLFVNSLMIFIAVNVFVGLCTPNELSKKIVKQLCETLIYLSDKFLTFLSSCKIAIILDPKCCNKNKLKMPRHIGIFVIY
jgi:hypothetical protein